MILKILERLHVLVTQMQKTVLFYWIPSHIGIQGNEYADTAAKAALDKRVSEIAIPYTDCKKRINSLMRKKWQSRWDEAVHNKLHAIHPTLGKFPGALQRDRRGEAVLARARIGHCHLTHSYLLKGEDQPECIPCGSQLTVEHVLVDCVDFAIIRAQYFNVRSMKQLFNTVSTSLILSYLKHIGLFKRF